MGGIHPALSYLIYQSSIVSPSYLEENFEPSKGRLAENQETIEISLNAWNFACRRNDDICSIFGIKEDKDALRVIKNAAYIGLVELVRDESGEVKGFLMPPHKLRKHRANAWIYL